MRCHLNQPTGAAGHESTLESVSGSLLDGRDGSGVKGEG
jgi:hypothetical protein